MLGRVIEGGEGDKWMDGWMSGWRDVWLAGWMAGWLATLEWRKGVRQDAKEGVRGRAGPGPGQGRNAGIGNDVMARYDSYD